MSDPAIKYKATMELARWRSLYFKVELKSPKHKAAQRWLAAAASELFDVAEVTHKAGGGMIAEALDGRAEKIIDMELSRDAVLGIRYAIIGTLTGQDNEKPASQLERWDLLEAASKIGPDGILRRQVESEAKLPTDDTVDEEKILDELDGKQDRRKDDGKASEIKSEEKKGP